MKAGELFVSLGIKGSEKTLSAISGVRKSLGDTAAASLTARAGILAAVYALEQMVATSNQVGTSLTNYNTVFGKSTEILQRYQSVGLKTGATAEEMAATFKNLQTTMGDIDIGKSVPGMWAHIAHRLGGISSEQMREMTGKPEDIMQLLQRFAIIEQNPYLRKRALDDLRIPENIQAGLIQQNFSPNNLKNANIYGDQEVKSLDGARQAWGRFANSVEMTIGRLNSKFGKTTADDIAKLGEGVSDITKFFVESLGAIETQDMPKLKKLVQDFISIDSPTDFYQQSMKNLHDKLPFLKKEEPAPAKTNNVNTTINNYGVEGANEAVQSFKREIQNAVLGGEQGRVT